MSHKSRLGHLHYTTGLILPGVLVFHWPCLSFFSVSPTPFLLYDTQEHGWTCFEFIPYFSCSFNFFIKCYFLFPLLLWQAQNSTLISKHSRWCGNLDPSLVNEQLLFLLWSKLNALIWQGFRNPNKCWSHKASACIMLRGGKQAILLPQACSHIQS